MKMNNGYNISISPTKHKISAELFEPITIVLDSYDEAKIKKAIDEQMFVDVKNLNEDDVRKVMFCFLNYRIEKGELDNYIKDEFFSDPRIVNTSIESRKFAFDKALQKIKEVKNNLNIDTIKMDTSCLVGISSDIFKNVSTKIFTKGAK